MDYAHVDLFCCHYPNLTIEDLRMEIDNFKPKQQEKKCTLSTLTRADGSVLLSQGATTVVAGCYGPVEAKPQKILIDRASVEVSYRPKAGIPGVGDRLYEEIIKNICETSLVTTLHPRSSVIVAIQEMQNSGGLISCAVNAACLALLDSGIDMKFLVAAVSCEMNDDGVLTLDPSRLEWENSKTAFLFVFESIDRKIVATHSTGCFTVAQFNKAMLVCREASIKVFQFYRNIMKEKILSLE